MPRWWRLRGSPVAVAHLSAEFVRILTGSDRVAGPVPAGSPVKGFVFGTAWDVMTLIAEGMKESEHSSRRPSKASLDVGALPICGDEISQSAYSPTWILWSSTLAMTATLSAPPLGRWRTRHIAAEMCIEDSSNLLQTR